MVRIKRKSAKPWRCEHGHVMGMVQQNGRGITQLWLYREAISTENGGYGNPTYEGVSMMAEVDVMAVVEGLVLDVCCSVCGSVRTWVPGEEAIKRLMEQVKMQEE